jgi:hypothetical protein
VRNETDDEFQRRMEEKGARLRYFARPVTHDGRPVDATFGENLTPPVKPKPVMTAPRGYVAKPKSDAPPAPRVRKVRKNARPDRCKTCSRPLRSSKQRAEDFPGTVLYHGDGQCKTCHKGGGPRKPPQIPSSCAGCGKPVRYKTDPPDGKTVIYHGRGVCKACYRKGVVVE